MPCQKAFHSAPSSHIFAQNTRLPYMSTIAENLQKFHSEVKDFDCTLVAVSKTKPVELLQEAYDAGQRVFGENKVQEMTDKHEVLPKDIVWHMIGHLQTNKVKYIAPFVSLIHAVDSLKLLKEINKQAKKNDRVIDCLVQLHIADEESKFGFSYDEAEAFLASEEVQALENVRIVGLMGMATNTSNNQQVKKEFEGLKSFLEVQKSADTAPNVQLEILSMGMSGDYKIALEVGSTMIRVGSSIFGARNYN